jgi:hypothetical protein
MTTSPEPADQQIAEIIAQRLTAEGADSGWAIAWVGWKIYQQLKFLDYAILGNSTQDSQTVAGRLTNIAQAIRGQSR